MKLGQFTQNAPKLGNSFEKHCLTRLILSPTLRQHCWVRYYCKHHWSTDPSWFRLLLVCNGGEGGVFLAHFGPLCTIWASLECNSLPYYCSITIAVTRLQSNRPLTCKDSLQHLCDASRSIGTGHWPDLPWGLGEAGPMILIVSVL